VPFDRFIECYNQERPHQAIEMRHPGERYRPSDRAYHGLDPLEYPCHDRTGVKEVEEKVWLISFMHYDMGFFDHESSRFEYAENPFAAKVLPM
jgi:hypothetical protein